MTFEVSVNFSFGCIEASVVCESIKCASSFDCEPMTSEGALPVTVDGDVSVTAGVLGLGKLISSLSSVGSDSLILGDASSGGCLSGGSDEDGCVRSCGESAGPAP